MRRRHPSLPAIWLMTDPRMGESLWPALERLPRGSGVVFRHYGVPGREALFERVAKIARRRGLVLVAADLRGSRHVHNGRHRGPGLRTAAAHSRREAIQAIRAGADLLFVSPVYATRSHPGARTLGRVRFGLLVRGLPVPVIALGGMTRARMTGLPGARGWAAIDAWSD
jgi:thiamine-phosphate pyrophosphorylase